MTTAPASVAVNPSCDLPGIVAAAGGNLATVWYDAGWLYVPGVTQDALEAAAAAAPTPDPMGTARARALALVDEAAEERRRLVLTPGAGQALVYQCKAAEAADCLAHWSAEIPPSAGTYPFLDAEVGISGGSVIEVAEAIAQISAGWRPYGAAIETIRLGAKRAIAMAADQSAINDILVGLSWPASPEE